MPQTALDGYFISRKRRLPESSKDESNASTATSRTKRQKQDVLNMPVDALAANFCQDKKQVVSALRGSGGEGAVGLGSVTSLKDGISETLPARHFKCVGPREVQRKLFSEQDVENPEPGLAKPIIKKRPTKASVPGMSPEKMKQCLEKCANISQLKQKLACFNNANMKLKNLTEHGQGSKISSKPAVEFEVSSPVKTPKKQSLSPKKTPAYDERFQHLIENSPTTLTLPYKFRFLKEAFHCLETVSSFLHNRKEIITFKKLKSSVQEMLSKNFTETQLGQIKSVFPFAYIFRREKDLPNHKVTPNNKNKWQLTIQVNTNYKVDMQMKLGTPQSPLAAVEYRKLTPLMLLERGKVFHASLLDILQQHHQEFLVSLDPPVVLDPACITKWHSEFQLDAVPDVPAAQLPAPPPEETGGTARDLLDRAHSVFSKYPNLERSLQAVAAAAPRERTPPRANPSQAATSAPPPPSGLPSGLLERVRAREAACQQRLMTRTPADSRRLEQLGRLPQLARSLRAAFVSERRAALPLETAVSRLADSSRAGLRGNELVQHLRLLAEEAPHFVQMMQLKAGTFVKMNRDTDVNKVVNTLEDKVKKA